MLAWFSQVRLGRTAGASGQMVLQRRRAVELCRLSKWSCFRAMRKQAPRERRLPREKLEEKSFTFRPSAIQARIRCLRTSRSSSRGLREQDGKLNGLIAAPGTRHTHTETLPMKRSSSREQDAETNGPITALGTRSHGAAVQTIESAAESGLSCTLDDDGRFSTRTHREIPADRRASVLSAGLVHRECGRARIGDRSHDTPRATQTAFY